MEQRTIRIGNFEISNNLPMALLAGPCQIESRQHAIDMAGAMVEITKELGINYVFKASFDKANRSSINTPRGVGLEEGLRTFAEIKKLYNNIPIVTDIHEKEQCEIVAPYVDILQIPAFLCRQTDLLVAAAKTGRIVNIKKGQFLAPAQMAPLAQKVFESGNDNILFTDRGVSFGYNNLVVDMRAIPVMQQIGYPVVFDATHSVQLPGGAGDCSGGERKFVSTLAKAAIAAGADALFFEVHPDPEKALCDGPNMLYLDNAEKLFKTCNDIFELVRNA